MNVLRLGTIVLILSTLAGGALAETFTIESLPYTFDGGDHSADEWDTLILSGNLSSTGNGIKIRGGYHDTLTNVLVLLGTDTITYGTGNGNSAIGIEFSEDQNLGLLQNIRIRGGYILHGATDTTVSGCRAIFMQGSYLYVDSIQYMTVRGYDGHLVDGGGINDYMWNITACKGRSYVTSYYRRDWFDGAAMCFTDFRNEEIAGDTSLYHVKVEGCRIDNTPNQGIHIGAREPDTITTYYVRALFHSDTVVVDSRNDQYPIDGVGYQDSIGGYYNSTRYSYANSYGLHIRFAAAGSEIKYCKVATDSTRYGGQGIFLDNDAGTVARPIRVVGNTVDICNGPNGEYHDQSGVALRLRYNPHVIVDSNYLRVRIDGDLGTRYRSYRAAVVRITDNTAGGFCYLRHNTIIAESLDDSANNDCFALCLDACTYDSIIAQYNHIQSSGSVYQFGFNNGGGGSGLTATGDTSSFVGVRLNDSVTYGVGYEGHDLNCTELYAIDGYYNGGTAPTDIAFSFDPDEPKEISIQRTLRIFVRGNNNLPVVGATITAINNYSQTVLSGTTDSGGLVSNIVTYRYEDHPAGNDSTAFNYFQLRANDGVHYDSNLTFTVGWTAAGGTDTLDLDVAGTGVWGATGEETDTITVEVTGGIIMRGFQWP